MKKDLLTDRGQLNFEEEAVKAFSFLETLGFHIVEASPTNVSYEKPFLRVNVYHGRQSYEIGFEMLHQGKRYTLSELIRVESPEAARVYRNSVALTPEAVGEGLRKIESLARRYALKPLEREPATFIALDQQKKDWGVRLASESQVASIRPRAEKAFRARQYKEAFELYDQIRGSLSPSEKRKADFARRRASIVPKGKPLRKSLEDDQSN